jgi:hypothetical protein
MHSRAKFSRSFALSFLLQKNKKRRIAIQIRNKAAKSGKLSKILKDWIGEGSRVICTGNSKIDTLSAISKTQRIILNDFWAEGIFRGKLGEKVNLSSLGNLCSRHQPIADIAAINSVRTIRLGYRVSDHT